jgi:hypothetical protein
VVNTTHVHHFLYYKLCRAVDIFQNLCRPFAIRAVYFFFLKVKLLESSSSPKINWIRAIDKKKYCCLNGVEQIFWAIEFRADDHDPKLSFHFKWLFIKEPLFAGSFTLVTKWLSNKNTSFTLSVSHIFSVLLKNHVSKFVDLKSDHTIQARFIENNEKLPMIIKAN